MNRGGEYTKKKKLRRKKQDTWFDNNII